MNNPVEARPPRILLLGHGGHGKGEVAKLLQYHYGLNSASSSQFMTRYLYETYLSQWYTSPHEAYQDRRNHRELWAALISQYNLKDPTRLARQIFKEYDIYDGMRMYEEWQAGAMARLWDWTVWVDAGNRVPQEPEGSMTIPKHGMIIRNEGTLAELEGAVHQLVYILNNVHESIGVAKLVRATEPAESYYKPAEGYYNGD